MTPEQIFRATKKSDGSTIMFKVKRYKGTYSIQESYVSGRWEVSINIPEIIDTDLLILYGSKSAARRAAKRIFSWLNLDMTENKDDDSYEP